MKIIGLYIERFGGLKNYTADYSGELNIINLPNESGKSTVAEFIHAMLYGFSASPRSLRHNLRKRYTPWDGGSMCGEMTVIHEGKRYIIKRTFGARKGDDTVSVLNGETGECIKPLSVDAPCAALTGVGEEAFVKSLYINRLFVVPDGTDEEIPSRLINLAQSGDEGVSYRRAAECLDDAYRDIAGSRSTGKLKLLRQRLTNLYEKKSADESRASQLEALKAELDELNERKALLNSHSARFSALPIICAVLLIICAFGIFLCPPVGLTAAFLFAAVAVLYAFCKFKQKRKSAEIIVLSEQIGSVKAKIQLLSAKNDGIDEEIKLVTEQLRLAETAARDIALAKSALDSAYEQLTQSFGGRLNRAVAEILSVVTDGKYDGIKTDRSFALTVHGVSGWESAEYLSDGAYDQIYFSLKMAIIALLYPDMPIILDDPFCRYDKKRCDRALEYLSNIDNQVIMFCCR